MNIYIGTFTSTSLHKIVASLLITVFLELYLWPDTSDQRFGAVVSVCSEDIYKITYKIIKRCFVVYAYKTNIYKCI